MSSDEKPLPAVPPTDEIVHPEKHNGTRVLERDPVDTCDCGGTVYDERIATGQVIIATWDPEIFDSDEFRLQTEYEQTDRRVRCDRCSAGWTY